MFFILGKKVKYNQTRVMAGNDLQLLAMELNINIQDINWLRLMFLNFFFFTQDSEHWDPGTLNVKVAASNSAQDNKTFDFD